MKLNKKNFLILKNISRQSGLPEFWLGGSATYAQIANKIGVKVKHNDYDLAIIGSSNEYSRTLKCLKAHNFKIIKNRPYFLKFNKAFQVIAAKEDLILDVAIAKNISHLGHFNWESIFWHYPSGKIHNPYNAISDLKKKRLRPIISINEENPFILASRFINLCSHFRIDFLKDRNLREFSESLSKKIVSWNVKDYFNNIYAKEHAYFNILKNIYTSASPIVFIGDLRASGLFGVIFPELNDFNISELKKNIKNISNLSQLVRFFTNNLRNNDKKSKSFNKKIKLIKTRLEDYEKSE